MVWPASARNSSPELQKEARALGTTAARAYVLDGFVYAAFISYSRADKVIAEGFQGSLERFRIPRTLRDRGDGGVRLPRRLVPVFRDISDGRASPDLNEAIRDALDKSAFLIVLCSPFSAESDWVAKEIDHFIRAGRHDRIIPVLVDGDAVVRDSTRPDGALNPSLSLLPSGGTPLMPDLRERADGPEFALLKVVAAMLDLAPYELSQRVTEQERRERRRAYVLTGVFALLAVFAGVAAWLAIDREKTALARQSELLGDHAQTAIEEDRPDLALAMSLEGLPLRPLWLSPSPDSRAARVSAFRAGRRIGMSFFLVGQDSEVSDCAFSPDGRMIASSSFDGTTRLWETATARPIGILPGHDTVRFSDGGASVLVGTRNGPAEIHTLGGAQAAAVYVPVGADPTSSKIAVSDDGKTVVVGGWEGGLTIWTVDDPASPTPLTPLDRSIGTLELSKDGTRLLAAQDAMPGDRVLGIYDPVDGTLLWSHTCDDCSINGAALSPNGTKVAILVGGALAEIRDTSTGKVERTLRAPDGERLMAVAWHPDADLVAVASARGLIAVYNHSTGERVWSKVGHGRNQVTALPIGLAFAPDADALLSATLDGDFRVWDATTGHALYGITTGGIAFTAMCLDSGRRRVALGSENGVLRGWEVSAIARPRRLFRMGEPVRPSVFLPGRTALFSLDGNRGEVLNLEDGSTTACGSRWPEEVSWLTSDDAGNFLAFLGPESGLHVAAVGQNCAFTSFPEYEASRFGPFDLGFAMAGERLIIAGDGLQIFDVSEGSRVARIDTPGLMNPALSLSEMHAALSVTTGDQIVRHVEQGTAVVRFGVEETGGANVVLSPSGRYVVFPESWANDDQPMTVVWDTRTRAIVHEWPHGPDTFVSEVVFSPDETRLVAATYNRTIRVFDLETGEIAATLKGHEANVSSLWMGPEGNHLLSLDTDGVLIAWDLHYGIAVEEIAYRPVVPRRRWFEVPDGSGDDAARLAAVVDALPGAEPGQWYILENDSHANRLTRLDLPADPDLGLGTACANVPAGFPGLGVERAFGSFADFGEASPCE